MKLLLCAECSRHVSDRAAACPFCDCRRLLEATRSTAVGRMARGALLASTVSAAVGAVAACGDRTDLEAPQDAGCTQDHWAPATLYGLFPVRDSGCR